jgi:hypothetical protein
MNAIFRSSAITLMLASTLLLNACDTKFKARTKASVGTKVATASASTGADSDCDVLDKTSFEVESALMGVEMGTDMGSMMITDSLDRAQKAIAKVAALKPKDPKVKALQTQYLSLVKAAVKPVEPLAKAADKDKLKAVAADVKAKVNASNEFRKEKIFFGDCKK